MQLPVWVYRRIANASGLVGRLGVRLNNLKRKWTMTDPTPNEASEALVAKPLPDMLKNLGLAVAAANKALLEANTDNPTQLAIHSAEIDLNIAVSIDKTTDFSASGGAALKVFSVNASYARSYNFKEEASSHIKIQLSAVPQQS